jgi:hypothetical protein
LIPGTVEAVETLKKKYNLKIGNTTGFQRIMVHAAPLCLNNSSLLIHCIMTCVKQVDVLLKEGNKQGYYPDCTVAGGHSYYYCLFIHSYIITNQN